MRFATRSKEDAVADLTKKLDRLPHLHANRAELSRMILGLNAAIHLFRHGKADPVNAALGAANLDKKRASASGSPSR